MSVQTNDWCGAKPLGQSETSNPIPQEGYTDLTGLEGVTTSAVDIYFDLHSQVVVIRCPCPPVVVRILIFYASPNTSHFYYSFPEYFWV